MDRLLLSVGLLGRTPEEARRIIEARITEAIILLEDINISLADRWYCRTKQKASREIIRTTTRNKANAPMIVGENL